VNEGLFITELTSADAMEAGHVLRRAYEQIYPEGAGGNYLDIVAAVEDRLGLAEVLGCWCQATLIGSCTLVLDTQTEMAEGLLVGEAGLRMLGVAPEYQGIGAGRALVEQSCVRAAQRGAQAVLLHTDTKMLTAQHLYRRMGFQRIPDRDKHSVYVDLLCYRLEITQFRRP
jgi:ribosomal protein S18 acetylase RimI-like enzyme